MFEGARVAESERARQCAEVDAAAAVVFPLRHDAGMDL